MTPLLPTDACPDCHTTTHPWWTEPQPSGTGIYAWYGCTVCGLSWRTGWAAEAVSLACPGCPECPSVEARAS